MNIYIERERKRDNGIYGNHWQTILIKIYYIWQHFKHQLHCVWPHRAQHGGGGLGGLVGK